MPTRPDPTNSRRLSAVPVALVLLTLVALGLRLNCLDCYGLWYDEVASVEIARRGPWAILTDRFGGMLVQTPLHYLTVWLTSLPIDPASSTVLVRLPSVMAGTLLVPVTFALGRLMFGSGAGLVAALLVAISPVAIGYSQDVRPYALLILFAALAVLLLLLAERYGGRRRWWAFTAALVAAIYASYFGLTLFLPVLLPYVAWVLARLWRERRDDLRTALFAPGVAALASIPIALDVLRVERASPDLSLLTPRLLFDQLVLLPTRLAQTGLGGEAEAWAQWLLFALAVAGAATGVLMRRAPYVALCALMLVVPALELALFRTTNQVFQRYASFALPFYMLLIGGGTAGYFGLQNADFGLIWRVGGWVLRTAGTAVALIFALGTYLYFTPAEHRRFSYLPDYRGAARYLAEVVGPDDLIVMLDEPALGQEVLLFYFRGAPPAPLFDSRDPRVASQRPSGDVYWVVSFFQNQPEFLQSLPQKDPRWIEPAYFERIVVLRERAPVDVAEGLGRFLVPLREQLASFQPVRTLGGVEMQAEGRVEEAAGFYREAGAYYPRLGAEFLESAKGYMERGDIPKAWREAATSLFMQPGDPQIHVLLSNLLAREGFELEANVARRIGDRLEASP
jgi:4-amino-4-deoxy-L-arabinose transferase-like glycosyltransferase